MKATLSVLLLMINYISTGDATVLAAAGYIAASSPVRDVLIRSGIEDLLKNGGQSLYDASGFRYFADQGTDIRRATMKNHSIVEIDNDGFHERNGVEVLNNSDDRTYSERLFGVVNEMDKNTCISRLLCEIGANPMSFGMIGLKINHYIRSVPPVTWNSATFPYIEAYQFGSKKGKNICVENYSTCTYNLKRVVIFLWSIVNPTHS